LPTDSPTVWRQKLTIYGYAITTIAFIASGWAIESGNVWLSAVLLLIVGLPMAISDYIGNFEGSSVNRISKRSLMPAIHGSFGVGIVLAAWVSAGLIQAHVSLLTNFVLISVFVFVPAAWAAGVFPVRHDAKLTAEQSAAIKALNRWVWRDRTTLLLAVIGFTFIMAEVAVNNWVPLALTGSGFTQPEAATALSVFWIIVTVVRTVGGPIVDRLGRLGTMLTSIAVTAVGVLVFMFDPILHAPFVGIGFWATGLSLGFPIVITALGGDESKASARVNLMITVVYISSVSVGPALGSLANVIGIYASFGIPLVMLALSALASPVLRRI